MRLPNFGDIGADPIIVGEVDVAIASEIAVSVEFVPPEKLTSRQLIDGGRGEAQCSKVEAQVSRAETLLDKPVKRNPHVTDEGRRERSHPVHDSGPVEPLEGLLPPCPGPLKTPLSLRFSVRLFWA